LESETKEVMSVIQSGGDGQNEESDRVPKSVGEAVSFPL